MVAKKTKNFILNNKGYLILIMGITLVILIFSHNFAILHIQGDSMFPTYKHGSVLIIKKGKEIESQSIVVFSPPDSWGAKNTKFIKRVVAKEGDQVEITQGYIKINNEQLDFNVFECENQELFVKLKQNEYFVLGDNHGISNDSLNQYCKGNDSFLVDESSIEIHGTEIFVIGGFSK